MEKSIRYEKNTIRAMIGIYCRFHHGRDLCASCQDVLDYSYVRIDKCKFGVEKPACNHCPVHCYRPEIKEKVKEVMRFAGPKMVYRHPVMAIRHFMR